MNLFGGHRLDFDDLVRAHLFCNRDNNLLRLAVISCPMHMSAGARKVAFKLLQVHMQVLKNVRANLPCALPQLLPVLLFFHQLAPLRLDGVRGAPHIGA